MRYRRTVSAILFLTVCCLLFSSGFLLGRSTARGTYTIMTEQDIIGQKIISGLIGETPGKDGSGTGGSNSVSHTNNTNNADTAETDDTEHTGITVNINTCTAEQLAGLPSIGETRARNIIRYREENGPFRSIADIMQVSGIGESIFNRIKQYICVDINDD